MRAFTADYLRHTRAGMWDDSREALAPLSLDDRERVLEVGCGSGALTRVLVEECADRDGESRADVVGCDVDQRLLAIAREYAPVVCGDATTLPFPDDSFDLVVCQALLINLPEPETALVEFARVSTDLVAVIEPDNASVAVESTVDREVPLERRARNAYLDGVETDVTLGRTGTRTAFEAADIPVVETRRYDQTTLVEAPYSRDALVAAKRKASGEGLVKDRETIVAGNFTDEEFDDLRSSWRSMGRSVVDQMQTGDYRRRETVPFYVTVGRV